MAFELLNSGRYEEAADCFRVTASASPFDGSLWAHLGRALHLDKRQEIRRLSKSKTCEPTNRTAELAFLSAEAHAAVSLAVLLGDPQAASFLPSSTRAVKAVESSCSTQPLSQAHDRFRALESTWRVFSSGNYSSGRHVVGQFCSTANISIAFTPEELASGIASSFSVYAFCVIMHICGVSVLQQIMPLDLLQDVAGAHSAVFTSKEKYTELAQKGVHAAQRGPARFEVKMPNRLPYSNESLAANPLLLPMVRVTLGAQAEVDTFSTIASLPGSTAQAWHSDVSFDLFEQQQLQQQQEHMHHTRDAHASTRRCDSPKLPLELPAHGLVVAAPLTSLTEVLGATEFITGSHVRPPGIDDTNAYWQQQQHEPISPVLKPILRAGDAVIFDVRLRHRGTANRSPQPLDYSQEPLVLSSVRELLYISYVKEWYADAVNFRIQGDGLSDDSVVSRGLYARVRARSYQQDLEDEVAGLRLELQGLKAEQRAGRG
jgi:ectoine hydroxylase-related dioxygenase (phytanoyl-CoA dioxygenase family)